jgi:hypothetical protein
VLGARLLPRGVLPLPHLNLLRSHGGYTVAAGLSRACWLLAVVLVAWHPFFLALAIARFWVAWV